MGGGGFGGAGLGAEGFGGGEFGCSEEFLEGFAEGRGFVVGPVVLLHLCFLAFAEVVGAALGEFVEELGVELVVVDGGVAVDEVVNFLTVEAA